MCVDECMCGDVGEKVANVSSGGGRLLAKVVVALENGLFW